MFSVIHRRNWQENQQKSASALPVQCQLCVNHEIKIKSLKCALENAKKASNERVQDLQKHVESLVSQNENLVKTIQKLLMCQNNTVVTEKTNTVDHLSKNQENEATVNVEEKKEKRQNETIKLINSGKTGVIGPQIKNKVKKGKPTIQQKIGNGVKKGVEKQKFGNGVKKRVKKFIKKGNYSAKTSPKVHNKGKAKKSVAGVSIEGKTVKVVLEKIDAGEIENISKRQANSNKDVHYVSSDEEVDSEQTMWTLEDTDDEDQIIDVVGTDSDSEDDVKMTAPQNGTQPTYKKCLWVESVGASPCNRMFKNSCDLGNHMQRCHRPKVHFDVPCLWHGCPRMGKTFSRRDTLNTHVFLHTGEKPFVCKLPGCGRSFTKKYNLQQHVCHVKGRPKITANPKTDFPPAQALAPPPAVRPNHKHHWCRFPRCGKKFATSKSLKQHQDNVHCPEPRFRCNTCSETFLHNGDLERHELAHQERSFEYLGSLSSNAGSPKRVAHVEEKRYRCMHPNCDRLLSSSVALRKHEQTHSGREPYRCSFPTCGRRFTEKSSVKKHLMRVHTGMRNRCRLEGCDERFANRLLCIEHQLHVHTHLFLNRNARSWPVAEAVTEESEPEPHYQMPMYAEVKRERADSLEDKDLEGSFTPAVVVKTEKVDLPEMDIAYEEGNYEKTFSEDDNSYDIDVNYEKEDEAHLVVENVKYLDVQNGISDTDADSIIVVDDCDPLLAAVPDSWRLPK